MQFFTTIMEIEFIAMSSYKQLYVTIIITANIYYEID